MNNLPHPISPAEPAKPFQSIAALREAHAKLADLYPEPVATPEYFTAVKDFLQSGKKTGALLRDRQERLSAQTLLDYWVTLLYQVNQAPPKANLEPYDAVQSGKRDLAGVPSPYLGLEAFQQKDHRLFFGRERLVKEDMLPKLSAHRLLAVLGPSGSGKSSVVLGGLVPELKDGALPGSENWTPIFMVPGSNPLENLAHAVCADANSPHDEAAAAQLQVDCRNDAQTLVRSVATTIERPALLVIDQFEELFTLCVDDDARKAFFANLLALVESPTPHFLVFTMRSEFYEREQEARRFPDEFREICEKSQTRVTPLFTVDLRRAIEGPARLVGLEFEDGVVDKLIEEVGQEANALPLLQFALLKLWDNKEYNLVTMATYRRLGGCLKALSNSADEFYSQTLTTDEQRAIAKRLLLRLVTPSDGTEVTRNRFCRSELTADSDTPAAVDAVLDGLVAARLLRMTSGAAPEDDQFEVTHEALTRHWPLLVRWLEEQREALKKRRSLEAKATEWQRLQGQGGLLDEFQLDEAERWLADVKEAHLGYRGDVDGLLAASREGLEAARLEAERAREKEEANRAALTLLKENERRKIEANRRLGIFVVGLVSIALVLAWAWAATTEQRNRATAREAEAIEAKAVAIKAKAVAISKADDADEKARRYSKLLYGARQNELSAKKSLLEATKKAKNIIQSANSRALNSRKLEISATQKLRIAQKNASAAAERAAQASTRLAVAQENVRMAKLERRKARQAAAKADKTRHDTVLATKKMLSEADDKLSRAKNQLRLALNERSVARAISLSANSDVEFARLDDGLPVSAALAVESLNVSQTQNGSNSLRKSLKVMALPLHPIDVGEPVVAVCQDNNGVTMFAAKNAANEYSLGVAGANAAIKSRMSLGQMRGIAMGQTQAVAVGIAPDGTLHSFTTDGTVIEKRSISPSMNGFIWLCMSQDSKTLAAIHSGGRIWVWRDWSKPPMLLEVDNPAMDKGIDTENSVVSAMAVSNYQSQDVFVAVSTRDKGISSKNTVRVWNVTDLVKILRSDSDLDFSGFASGAVNSLAFSPDASKLALGTGPSVIRQDDSTFVLAPAARIWLIPSRKFATSSKTPNLPYSQELQKFPHHLSVTNVVFSPDGGHIVTTSSDWAARTWSIYGGKDEARMSGPSDLTSVSYSADGRKVLTGSKSGILQVWDPHGVDRRNFTIALSEDDDGIFRTLDGRYVVPHAETGTGFRVMQISRGGKQFLLGELGGRSGLASISSPAKQYTATRIHNQIEIFENDKRKRALKWTLAPSGSPIRMAFSHDGQHLVTAALVPGAKGFTYPEIQIWQMKNGQIVATVPLVDSVEDIGFSNDGNVLIIKGQKGDDHWLYPWNSQGLEAEARRRMTRNLTESEWKRFMGSEPYRRTAPNLPKPPNRLEDSD